jgi:hypothetical protein
VTIDEESVTANTAGSGKKAEKYDNFIYVF